MPHKKQPTDVYKESVYRLIPKEIQTPEKPPVYTSIYHPMAVQEYKGQTKKELGKMKSMGPAHVKRENPNAFLKKKTGGGGGQAQLKQLPRVDHHHQHEGHKHRLPLWEPTHEIAKPIHLPKLKPRRSEPDLFDYRFKKDYGQPPAYLQQHSQVPFEKPKVLNRHPIRSNKNEKPEPAPETLSQQQAKYVQLAEEERLMILQELKKKHDLLSLEFGKLPLVIDTVPKKNRKVGLEKELKRVEDDLEKFSREVIMIRLN